MHSLKQSMRRPVRTLLGILLITLAVAVLCVCLGQSFSASVADDGIEERFITVAFPSDTYSGETHDWALAYAAEHPDIVKSVSSSVLASAHIGSLRHDNFTDHLHYITTDYLTRITYSPYDRAVLEITLTGIDEGEDGLLLRGVIDTVIALEEGYSDPTGFEAEISVGNFPASDFELGGRYLFCAQSYVDRDYLLRNSLAQIKKMELFDAFEHDKFEVRRGGARIKYGDLFTFLSDAQLVDYREVSFKIATDGSAPSYVRLNSTVDDLLSSGEGSEWKRYIDDLAVSYRTFPIIGVDDMMYLSQFARGNAEIFDGSNFTAEQVASGARVCIVSEMLAHINGISVGDKIDLSYYEKNQNDPNELLLSEGVGVNNPTSAYYDSLNTPLSASEEYTVVGIYRKGDAWSVFDLQNITPNTVFVPKPSITVAYEEAIGGIFTSFVLKNGTIEEFAQAVAEAGFDETLLFDDGGYAKTMAGLEEYDESADRIVPLGFAVWSVVILLFLMLYPARMGRELDTMDSLGARRIKRVFFVIGTSSIILFAGSVLGLGAGLLLWNGVTDYLTASISGELDLGVSMSDFVRITAAQLGIALVAVAILALPLTRTRKLDRRK